MPKPLLAGYLGGFYRNYGQTYHGTDSGSLGHMSRYTSYDYGTAITERTAICREKCGEHKLEVTFFKCFPTYLTVTLIF
ncbi:beta-galactosidase E [Penicillium cf. griseofulvum]|uniref:Beta-galactosidase E n=1 Tax=Penicillium cf. griseofulvum TaxID=2972120 RepID=A0A9W9JNT0_9EURO|nr:beta-galactosidase E [Penicillium cf. griseofulvum]KAJ5424244.1 beta-galactosidase E [Penicillium cf. griseofulvum]KAJ5442518.1 beta-galactosidase E [Penicillium cf. griseofulvum]